MANRKTRCTDTALGYSRGKEDDPQEDDSIQDL